MLTRKNILVLVLVVSASAVIWTLFFRSAEESISFTDFIGVITSLISVLGISQETKRPTRKVKGRKASASEVQKPFRLSPSFESGLYGGLIGGALAGLIIGISYYFSTVNSKGQSWVIIPQIFIYASLTGTVLGALSQVFILWFRHLTTKNPSSALFLNEISGGVLGGMIGGIPIGALGGWIFGLRPTLFIDLGLLAIGAGLGAVCISLGALLYNYEGQWRKVMRSLVISAIVTTGVVALGLALLQFFQVSSFFYEEYEEVTALTVTTGGALIGLVIGVALGLQIGLTLYLYRVWETMTKDV